MEKCAGLCLTTPEEQKEIKKIVDEYLAENPYLYNNKHLEYVLCGVASHHAGLLPGWKVLIEKKIKKGLIKVVFASSFTIFLPTKACSKPGETENTSTENMETPSNCSGYF